MPLSKHTLDLTISCLLFWIHYPGNCQQQQQQQSSQEDVVGQTCDQLRYDIPSRTALAPIVFEGRARRVEAPPTWAANRPSDSKYINVTFKPRSVFKGSLPLIPNKDFATIVVGRFGLKEDSEGCIPSIQIGSRYIVFLQGNATATEYNEMLYYYQIDQFPEPYSRSAIRTAQEYSCLNCTSQPVIKSLPNELQLQLNQKLQLRCLLAGKPTPRVTWYKDGTLLLPNKHIKLKNGRGGGVSLRINKVSLDDGGSYSCKARNVLGEASGGSTRVTVVPTSEPEKQHAERCPTQTYCLNGGICYVIPALGRKFCECDKHFTGLRCQDRDLVYFILQLQNSYESYEKRLETLLVATILMIVVFMLLALTTLLCVIKRRGNGTSRRRKSTKNSRRQTTELNDGVTVHVPLWSHTSVQTEPHYQNLNCDPNFFIACSQLNGIIKPSSSNRTSTSYATKATNCNLVPSKVSSMTNTDLSMRNAPKCNPVVPKTNNRFSCNVELSMEGKLKKEAQKRRSCAFGGCGAELSICPAPIDINENEDNSKTDMERKKTSEQERTKPITDPERKRTSGDQEKYERKKSSVEVNEGEKPDELIKENNTVAMPRQETVESKHLSMASADSATSEPTNDFLGVTRWPNSVNLAETKVTSPIETNCHVNLIKCNEVIEIKIDKVCHNECGQEIKSEAEETEEKENVEQKSKIEDYQPLLNHTVPKKARSSKRRNNILNDQCCSDYDGESPASDLEVNMESEVDILALNASEEELGQGQGQEQMKVYHRANYESSIETTDSDSSASSNEHGHMLFERLKLDHGVDLLAAVEAAGKKTEPFNFESFNCPFSFEGLDHTFTLNPYDVMYAQKYAVRNQLSVEPESSEPVSETADPIDDRYPFDPDPDATVI